MRNKKFYIILFEMESESKQASKQAGFILRARRNQLSESIGSSAKFES